MVKSIGCTGASGAFLPFLELQDVQAGTMLCTVWSFRSYGAYMILREACGLATAIDAAIAVMFFDFAPLGCG